MERNPVVYAIIGHAMAAHREIGVGLEEEFYHQLISQRLTSDGIEHAIKPRATLVHRGRVAAVFEPDLVLPQHVIPELKVLRGCFAAEHYLQLKGYLKFWKIHQGLLLDFGKESLMFQSYLYDDPPACPVDIGELVASAPSRIDPNLAQPLVECCARVATVHGFGYTDTTYQGLMAVDLDAEGLSVNRKPMATLTSGGRLLGTTILRCIVVQERFGLLVVSQREALRAADRAVLQTALHHLSLPWGLIVHFSKRDLKLQWVLAGTASTSIRCGS